MEFKNAYLIETTQLPADAAWIEDRVEVYFADFTLYFKAANREEAKRIFKEAGITWHYC